MPTQLSFVLGSFDAVSMCDLCSAGKHLVHYNDGAREHLRLRSEAIKWLHKSQVTWPAGYNVEAFYTELTLARVSTSHACSIVNRRHACTAQFLDQIFLIVPVMVHLGPNCREVISFVPGFKSTQ